MASTMNVLFVAAEMAPLIKVGGLADVAGALPKALRATGLDVRVAMPLYSTIDRTSATKIADVPGDATLWQTDVENVPVLLIEHEPSFGREHVYGYPDDNLRYLNFCDALLGAAAALAWQPDILHLNDWHPGFLATRLAAAEEHPWYCAARVSTIHNLGFVGQFDASFARTHGLQVGKSTLELSSLAQSIIHAELISTVSATYARELLTPEFGGKLTELLRARSDRLSGILNGIDVALFDPTSDPHLASNFDSERIEDRHPNKTAIQRRMGLPETQSAPLVGMVSRLFSQKGVDLAAEAMSDLLERQEVQLVVLGQGDEENERCLLKLASGHPRSVAIEIGFDVALGQLIYAGSDIFLMPSRYEPCGLGQFIAMRYGSVPVVRRTGGLADSVFPFNAGDGSGTGFLFDETTPDAVLDALEQALEVYGDKDAWRRLQARAMGQDFSWTHSAGQYADLYQKALDLKHAERSEVTTP